MSSAPRSQAFDTVLEKSPENNKTADAIYMKGMALLKSGQRNEAARRFSERDHQVSECGSGGKSTDTQRKALGLSVPAAHPQQRSQAAVIHDAARDCSVLPVLSTLAGFPGTLTRMPVALPGWMG